MGNSELRSDLIRQRILVRAFGNTPRAEKIVKIIKIMLALPDGDDAKTDFCSVDFVKEVEETGRVQLLEYVGGHKSSGSQVELRYQNFIQKLREEDIDSQVIQKPNDIDGDEDTKVFGLYSNL